MAPYLNSHESAIDSNVDLDRLKTKAGVNNVKLAATAKPPVPDDYMYDFKYNHALPTSDVLGIEIPADCNAQKEAEGIVDSLSEVMGKGDAQGFADLFIESGMCASLLLGSIRFATTLGSSGRSTDNIWFPRCLARQALLHMGLSNLQLQACDPKGRQ